jgi:two-component system chemotaxis response regulator CheY
MPYQFQNITVLIVDSQPAIVDLIKEVLKMFGVKDILTCTDGKSGLKTFRGRKPDLLIVDWDLKNISGIEFTKAVRHDQANPYVPIIFTTSLSSVKRVSAARDSGITEFLRKPFTAEALYKRIEAIVEKPRPFVQSDEFVGPDRRRKTDKDFKGVDRRGNWVVDVE